MLIVLEPDVREREIARVEEAVRSLGFTPRRVAGPTRVAVCVTGNETRVEAPWIANLPGVRELLHVTAPYKLCAREVRAEDTVVEVRGVRFGGPKPAIVAGPCSVETESRTLRCAEAVKEAGADAFRGGAFKPRTSPYSFRGLGDAGLRILERVRQETGLPVVTEVLDPGRVDQVAEVADVLQVGARNMQNFPLLERLGEAGRPVLLKRAPSATLEEWLMAAEYVLAAGNPGVLVCERGIRTFNRHCRNTLDLGVVPAARAQSHLPVLVDPSHAAGRRDFVEPLARAALAVGAQGLLVEAHNDPDRAYSDRAQTIDVATLARIVRERDRLAAARESA